MQKPLTPKQQLEQQKLDTAIRRAEQSLLETEKTFGKLSPEYAVAERLRDEMLAKMQRIAGAIDATVSEPKPAASRVTTVVVKSRRTIKR